MRPAAALLGRSARGDGGDAVGTCGRPERWRLPAAPQSPPAAPGAPMESGPRNAIVFNASKGESFTPAGGYKALRKRLRGSWKVQR